MKETCKNVWNFCFKNIQYELDEQGKEQVRRPARAWRDRFRGIDCDDFVVMVGSILTNLGIPFIIRLTRYEQPTMEHTYPIAKDWSDLEIVVDCVVHGFNYEVPYTEKKDYEMELQYLNGIPGERYNEFGDRVEYQHDLPIDAQDLFGDEPDLTGLGASAKKQERQQRRAENKEQRKTDTAPLKEKLKEGLKKGVNAINKVNPATALLRAGILASMKLNLFQAASTLRFAYWSKEQALKNEMEPAKYDQLQQVRAKLEKIYFGAGGNTPALREAILTGKGNQDRMVQLNGLGAIIPSVRDEDSMRTILGEDLFNRELAGFDGLHGLGNLGAVVATSAAVAAASGVMASVSGLLKKMGNLFKKGSAASQKVLVKANTDAAEEQTRKFSVKNLVNTIKSKIQERRERKSLKTSAPENYPSDEADAQPVDETVQTGEETTNEVAITDEPFTEHASEVLTDESEVKPKSADNKSTDQGTGMVAWVKANPGKTALIGLGAAGLTWFVIHSVKKSREAALAGLPKNTGKKKGGKKKATANKKPKLEKIELL
ncbi:MAG: hypothetical protein HYZ14_15355 [Bacteroidetes bacterium]|nr:hypothetical protein [Bacteroidota bacterium]